MEWDQLADREDAKERERKRRAKYSRGPRSCHREMLAEDEYVEFRPDGWPYPNKHRVLNLQYVDDATTRMRVCHRCKTLPPKYVNLCSACMAEMQRAVMQGKDLFPEGDDE